MFLHDLRTQTTKKICQSVETKANVIDRAINYRLQNACVVDLAQKSVTEFFNTLTNKASAFIREEPEILHHVQTFAGIPEEATCDHLQQNIPQLLQMLVDLAEQNSSLNKHARRYDEKVKNIASYLYIICGLYGYEILSKNLDLPSPSTIHNHLEEMPSITESVIMAQELKTYLLKHNYPLFVWISEDATRVVPKIQYYAKEDQLTGKSRTIRNGYLKSLVNSFPHIGLRTITFKHFIKL